MTVDRKAQLLVTCMFRHLTDDEKDELAALLLDETQPSEPEYRHEDACRCGVVGDATLPCHEPSDPSDEWCDHYESPGSCPVFGCLNHEPSESHVHEFKLRYVCDCGEHSAGASRD